MYLEVSVDIVDHNVAERTASVCVCVCVCVCVTNGQTMRRWDIQPALFLVVSCLFWVERKAFSFHFGGQGSDMNSNKQCSEGLNVLRYKCVQGKEKNDT